MESILSSEAFPSQLCEHQPKALDSHNLICKTIDDRSGKMRALEVQFFHPACSAQEPFLNGRATSLRIVRDGFRHPIFWPQMLNDCPAILQNNEPAQDAFLSVYNVNPTLRLFTTQSANHVISRNLVKFHLRPSGAIYRFGRLLNDAVRKTLPEILRQLKTTAIFILIRKWLKPVSLFC